MTGCAKRLQIGQIEGQFRVSADGLDVIDFKPAARAAVPTFEAVAAKRGDTKRGPAVGSCSSCRVSFEARDVHSGLANIGRMDVLK